MIVAGSRSLEGALVGRACLLVGVVAGGVALAHAAPAAAGQAPMEMGEAVSPVPEPEVAEDPVATHPLPVSFVGGATRPVLNVGESFEYSIQYGPIKAGTAKLTVDGVEDIDGRACYRVVSTAHSNMVISAFYKVRDRVESYVDIGALVTRKSTKDLQEGDHHRRERLVWNHDAGLVVAEDGGERAIERGARDILGAFYFVRTLDLEVGDRVPLQTYDDDKSYELWIEVVGEETVDTPVGRFDCLVYEPTLLTDGLFKRSGSLKVWITRDAARLPVMMQSKIKIGAVSAILVDLKRGRPLAAGEQTVLSN